jgi:hypothetical protein
MAESGIESSNGVMEEIITATFVRISHELCIGKQTPLSTRKCLHLSPFTDGLAIALELHKGEIEARSHLQKRDFGRD